MGRIVHKPDLKAAPVYYHGKRRPDLPPMGLTEKGKLASRVSAAPDNEPIPLLLDIVARMK